MYLQSMSYFLVYISPMLLGNEIPLSFQSVCNCLGSDFHRTWFLSPPSLDRFLSALLLPSVEARVARADLISLTGARWFYPNLFACPYLNSRKVTWPTMLTQMVSIWDPHVPLNWIPHALLEGHVSVGFEQLSSVLWIPQCWPVSPCCHCVLLNCRTICGRAKCSTVY